MDCGKLKPEDIPRCPYCGGVLTIFFSPVDMLEAPAYNYGGPVAICRNDDCSYYKNSFEHTRKQMGCNLGYRHAYICATKTDSPISTRVTDNEALFVNAMGEMWIRNRAAKVGWELALLDAIRVVVKQWNEALKVHAERIEEIEERPEALWSGREIVVN